MAADRETDFSKMSLDEVTAVARQARKDLDQARTPHLERLGMACARMHSLGMTWSQIGREMGVNLSTAYRWAKPYLPE